MSTVTVQELERDPLGLLNRVEAGENVVVTRDQYPVAELRPIKRCSKTPRPMGLCAGEFTVPDDFDDPLPEEILREFEGR